MPFKTLNNWLWDGDRKSPVPVILLKSGSPVTHINIITMFINNGPLNSYLDEYLNNFYLFRIDKEELLKFIKKCIFDFKIRKYSTFYSKRPPSQGKLYDVLREKYPIMKNDDITLLTELILLEPNRDNIFESLGLEVSKVIKIKEKKSVEKISMKTYISKNYNVLDVK